MPRWLSMVDTKPSQKRCLGRLLKKAKATSSNLVRGSTKQPLGSASASLHLRNPITPSRKLSHLTQNVLLRLLTIHPSRIHGTLHHVLKLSLKRQQLPLHIRAMNTVQVVRVLSTMLLTRRHRHPTTLTAQRERHTSDKEQVPTIINNLTGHHANKQE